MFGKPVIAMMAAIVSVAGIGAAVASPASVDHAADKAHEAAAEGASFLRDWVQSGSPASSDGVVEEDRRCDEYDTHGAYVSETANATRAADSQEDNASRGEAIREAAQSDVGKCGGPDEAAEGDSGNETQDEDSDEDDAENETLEPERGQSQERRAEHPPRNNETRGNGNK